MQAWTMPTTATELRGFLGLTGYYRKFVRQYGVISQPLTHLLRKNVPFVWTVDSQVAFDTLKQALVSAPVLALPDFQVPFVVETDACATGIGAVLMQQGHPLAYLSKALCHKYQALSTYEKGMLGPADGNGKVAPVLATPMLHHPHRSSVIETLIGSTGFNTRHL